MSTLQCVSCGREFPFDAESARCHVCDEALEVVFEPGPASPDVFAGDRAPFFDKYRHFYPYLQSRPEISLGEGATPLVPTPMVAKELGYADVLVKNEAQNPTWSFKDRGSVCSVQHALALSYSRIGTLSSGNMGASIAAFGSRAGMETYVVLRETTTAEKVNALMIYGARAIRISGAVDDLYERIREAGRRHRIFLSLADEPMRVEGYKSIAFEIYEQLGREIPDIVCVPVGSGGLIRGVIKGFEELVAAGVAARMPFVMGVQTEGCSPTADAFSEGRERTAPFPNPRTLDHVLENPRPLSGTQVVRKIRQHGGTILKVSNNQVIQAMTDLGRQGIFVQPASATTLAGLKKARAAGVVESGARAVAVLSGSGLKYPPVLETFAFTPVDVAVEDLAGAFERAVAG